jgi:hypothetical protein
VDFPTGIQYNSSTATGNIFIHFSRCGNDTICTRVNGLSHHDARTFYTNNTLLQIHSSCMHFMRKFNKASMNSFLPQLSYETWGSIFVDQDTDSIFNSFPNTYLRIFYSSFPKKLVKTNTKYNPSMTRGIKILGQHKRELYLSMEISNNPNHKYYFKTYFKSCPMSLMQPKIFIIIN